MNRIVVLLMVVIALHVTVGFIAMGIAGGLLAIAAWFGVFMIITILERHGKR